MFWYVPEEVSVFWEACQKQTKKEIILLRYLKITKTAQM